MTQATTPKPMTSEITYEAYLALPESTQPTEVIDGVLQVMNAPTTSHQIILTNLVVELSLHVRAQDLGMVLSSPLDVLIRRQPKLTVRQPDLMVFTNAKAGYRIRSEQSRFQDTLPVPALAVEILSPGQNERTMAGKLADYADLGVDEVWLIDQDQRRVRVLSLDHGNYRSDRGFGEGGRLASIILPGLDLEVSRLFEL